MTAGYRLPELTRRPNTCPHCGAGQGGYGVHAHSLSWWCLNCGAAANFRRPGPVDNLSAALVAAVAADLRRLFGRGSP